MLTGSRWLFFLVLALCFVCPAVWAQTAAPEASRDSIAITASATTDRVRFTAASNIMSMRVEVFGENGEKVFDSNMRAGNLFDWQLQSEQPLNDGSYLCVVTVQSLSGKVSRKLGMASVAHQQLS